MRQVDGSSPFRWHQVLRQSRLAGIVLFERRKNPRKAVEVSAWIALSGSSPLQACTILDMSEGGARIFTANASVWPDRLDICFTPDGIQRRACEVLWRSGGQFGVRVQPETITRHSGKPI